MTTRAGQAGREAELKRYREELYGCFPRRRDALFELCDALATSGHLASPPPCHLSLGPSFTRGWGSAYGALARGRVDEAPLRRLLVGHRPRHWPKVFAVDTSSWPRCDAECSPERGFYHHPSRHSAGKPVVAGWNYSWVSQLCFDTSSWSAPVDVRRFPPTAGTTTATASQVRDLVQLLEEQEAQDDDHDGGGSERPEVPLFVLDGGYDPAGLTDELGTTRAQVLVRVRADRVFYRDPPPPIKGADGRPRRHGKRFCCAGPGTWGEPDATLSTTDPRYGQVEVQSWAGLHPRLSRQGRWAKYKVAPVVRGTVLRVRVEHLPKSVASSGVTKELWLWWAGPGSPDLDLCWQAYVHRFDIEHTLRFGKNTLGWTTPRVRSPEQADRWSLLVAAVYNELRLARGLVVDNRLPWEPPRDPAKLTPVRVRRGFWQLVHNLGTPAKPPKPTKAGPGRPKGSTRGPATRYPPIKKAA
jgi:hypothetical protein